MTTRGISLHNEFPEFLREKLLEQYWPRLGVCVHSIGYQSILGCLDVANL